RPNRAVQEEFNGGRINDTRGRVFQLHNQVGEGHCHLLDGGGRHLRLVGNTHIKTIGRNHAIACDANPQDVVAVGEDGASPEKHLLGALGGFVIHRGFGAAVDGRQAGAVMAGDGGKDIDLHAFESDFEVVIPVVIGLIMVVVVVV